MREDSAEENREGMVSHDHEDDPREDDAAVFLEESGVFQAVALAVVFS